MLLNAVVDQPHPTQPGSATWHHSEDRFQAVGVWTEMRAGLGEDAEPTIMWHPRTRTGLIAVYDGLGGSGAAHIGQASDGRRLSHAFVASRLANLTVQSWFADRVETGLSGPDLRTRLRETFRDARPRTRNKLSGTLRRDLPTTLASLEFRVDAKRVEAVARWAGDSRCMVLTPDHGLQQLSRDDSELDDALEILIADQPMTNLVSATGDFRINERVLTFPLPCVLICATDGFFNYVAAPAVFELYLHHAINQRKPAAIAAELASVVRGYTQDDASLAMVLLGTPNMFDKLHDRWKKVHAVHGRLVEGLPDRDELVAARRESWAKYRDEYMRYLRGADA